MIEINDDNFRDEVILSDKPVVVDFFAEWCGPCDMIEPMFRGLEEDFGDKVKFGRCNVDLSTFLTSEFNIRSIPTFMFFKDGEMEDVVVGTAAKTVFSEKINRMI